MAAVVYTMQHYIAPLVGNLADPDGEKNEQAKIRAEAHLQRLRRHKGNADDDDDGPDSRPLGVAELALNEYESQVAMEMVAPQDIHVGFDGEHCPVRS
jgi:SpoVK/Ycf46/Vps4 family AAA+-type ATPase